MGNQISGPTGGNSTGTTTVPTGVAALEDQDINMSEFLALQESRGTQKPESRTVTAPDSSKPATQSLGAEG